MWRPDLQEAHRLARERGPAFGRCLVEHAQVRFPVAEQRLGQQCSVEARGDARALSQLEPSLGGTEGLNLVRALPELAKGAVVIEKGVTGWAELRVYPFVEREPAWVRQFGPVQHHKLVLELRAGVVAPRNKVRRARVAGQLMVVERTDHFVAAFLGLLF